MRACVRACVRVYIAIAVINNFNKYKIKVKYTTRHLSNVTDLLIMQRYRSISHVHNTSGVAVLFLSFFLSL